MRKLQEIFSPTRVVATILLGWSLLYLFGARTLELGQFDHPGSGAFPTIIGSLLCLFCLTILITSKNKKESWDIPNKRALLLLGFMLVYLLTISDLGYIISTFVLIFSVLKFVENTSWFPSLYFSLAITFISYYIFVYGFLITLPEGLFYL